MPGWGNTWTTSSVYQYQDEADRQKKVVKQFIADHPEYDPSNDDNNRALVDFIEASKKPFNRETIEWAYEQLKFLIKPKKTFSKISTTNIGAYASNDTPDFTPPPTIKGYLDVQVVDSTIKVPYYDTNDVVEISQKVSKLNDTLKGMDVETKPVYDKDVAPTRTVRRIKDDTD